MRDSIWFRTLSTKDLDALDGVDELPRTADVAVVGGGLIGLATAFYLSEAGVANICVLDRSGLAAEASGANAGGLWFAQHGADRHPLSELGQLSSRLYDELGRRFAIDLRRHGILELAYDDNELTNADQRAKAMREAGFRAELLRASEVQDLEPRLDTGRIAGALRGVDDGQVHPAKLAAAWSRELRGRGVRLCGNTEVLRLGPPLETARGPLDADIVAVAAGAWTPLLTAAVGWRPPIRPIRGTLLALPPQPPALRHTVMARRYYYWQLPDGPLAGGGSEDDIGFERGAEPGTIESIRQELDTLFPSLASHPTFCAWSGFRPYCEGQLPVLGRIPGREDLFVAAGHFKKGVALAPASGKTLADLIVNGKSAVELAAFDPGRFALQDVVPAGQASGAFGQAPR